MGVRLHNCCAGVLSFANKTAATQGEHGIGIGKKASLVKELGVDTIGVMQKVKASLDPLWIMNPGKKVHVPRFSHRKTLVRFLTNDCPISVHRQDLRSPEQLIERGFFFFLFPFLDHMQPREELSGSIYLPTPE